jgi:hypothetical protein
VTIRKAPARATKKAATKKAATKKAATKKAATKKAAPERTATTSGSATTVHVRETFEDVRGDWTLRLRDHRFERCAFVNGGLSQKEGHWAEVERLTFEDCTVQNRGIGQVICREVMVRNVKRSPTFILRNSMFDRVTFEGELGAWFFMWLDDKLSEADVARVTRFYEEVPFAIDIRKARFRSITLRGIPGDKILRDPANSVLVRRRTLEASDAWRGAPGVWPKLFGLFLTSRPAFASTVYAAGLLSKDLEKELAGLDALRRAGLAE